MMAKWTTSLLSCVLGSFSLVCGCGLIDPDITQFDVSLPNISYSVDSAEFGVTGDQAALDALLSTDCTQLPTACADAAATVCTPEQCTASCSEALGTCVVEFKIELAYPVNMKDLPQLSALDNAVIDVKFQSADYEVPTNTLNFETPAIALFVGPSTATSSTEEDVSPIATMPAVPAGTTRPRSDLDFVPGGQQLLVDSMSNVQTPFALLTSTTVVLQQGAQIPTGQATIGVRVIASASL